LEWRSSLFGYLCKSRGKINEKSQDNLKKKKKKKKKQVLEYNSVVVVVVSSRPIFGRGLRCRSCLRAARACSWKLETFQNDQEKSRNEGTEDKSPVSKHNSFQ
jgi:hypothetical protein